VTLFFNQTLAMFMKKFYYTFRNYMMLFIQFVVPLFFLVITMLLEDLFDGDQDLPELRISFFEYLQTITVYESSFNASNTKMQGIFDNYKNYFDNIGSEGNHELRSVEPGLDLEDTILFEYRKSMSNVNLNYMIGTSFNGSDITAWFNNQAFHTAPLTINAINNAIYQ
jgi:ATP-binding cassette subfamily A (ABC1) protein 3